MHAGKWDDAKLYAAVLASYVAAAHDPFNTTDNMDGHLSAQRGINERFGTSLVDRLLIFFFMRPNDAVFIPDSTDHAFEACLSSHSWLETVLYADRDARRGLNAYTDEYYDHFYNQAGAVLIRQISDAATDVGSFWLTAWKNAGHPNSRANALVFRQCPAFSPALFLVSGRLSRRELLETAAAGLPLLPSKASRLNSWSSFALMLL